MSIRALALDWLAARHRIGSGRILTSQCHVPPESGIAGNAWSVQVRLSALDQSAFLHLVLQRAPGSTDFRYLQVPTAYLRQHAKGLATVKETHLSLLLDAGPHTFIDRRGKSGVAFGQFEITEEHT